MLCIGVPGIHSRWALCPPACVCLEPLAIVVLFTQWIAPVSCFLRHGWVQVTAAACISTHLVPRCSCCHLHRTHRHGIYLYQLWCFCLADSLQHIQVVSFPYQTFYYVISLPLGNTALDKRGFSTSVNSSWRRIRWKDWKNSLWVKTKKTKPKQQPFTTLRTFIYGYCNVLGFLV